ncbi:Centrosomal protein cep57L1 [Clydaea vesicula]|uniref:Centrosomal protein cep57L1 n=1 Tax=Clydaea vesicula TaxID=447962 RepID=A0AAD5U1D5_9FUNG|nr:Centrosomal protein cep57L1 [Clydaea vesicula]
MDTSISFDYPSSTGLPSFKNDSTVNYNNQNDFYSNQPNKNISFSFKEDDTLKSIDKKLEILKMERLLKSNSNNVKVTENSSNNYTLTSTQIKQRLLKNHNTQFKTEIDFSAENLLKEINDELLKESSVSNNDNNNTSFSYISSPVTTSPTKKKKNIQFSPSPKPANEDIKSNDNDDFDISTLEKKFDHLIQSEILRTESILSLSGTPVLHEKNNSNSTKQSSSVSPKPGSLNSPVTHFDINWDKNAGTSVSNDFAPLYNSTSNPENSDDALDEEVLMSDSGTSLEYQKQKSPEKLKQQQLQQEKVFSSSTREKPRLDINTNINLKNVKDNDIERPFSAPVGNGHNFYSNYSNVNSKASLHSLKSANAYDSGSDAVSPDSYRKLTALPEEGSSRAVISALRTLQEKIARLETEKMSSKNRIINLEEELAAEKRRLIVAEEERIKEITKRKEEEENFERKRKLLLEEEETFRKSFKKKELEEEERKNLLLLQETKKVDELERKLEEEERKRQNLRNEEIAKKNDNDVQQYIKYEVRDNNLSSKLSEKYSSNYSSKIEDTCSPTNKKFSVVDNNSNKISPEETYFLERLKLSNQLSSMKMQVNILEQELRNERENAKAIFSLRTGNMNEKIKNNGTSYAVAKEEEDYTSLPENYVSQDESVISQPTEMRNSFGDDLKVNIQNLRKEIEIERRERERNRKENEYQDHSPTRSESKKLTQKIINEINLWKLKATKNDAESDEEKIGLSKAPREVKKAWKPVESKALPVWKEVTPTSNERYGRSEKKKQISESKNVTRSQSRGRQKSQKKKPSMENGEKCETNNQGLVGNVESNRDMPFVVGKNVGKSYSVTANIQNVFSLLKAHNPALCSVCSKRKSKGIPGECKRSYNQKRSNSPTKTKIKNENILHHQVLEKIALNHDDESIISATSPQWNNGFDERSLDGVGVESLIKVLNILEGEFSKFKSKYHELVEKYEEAADFGVASPNRSSPNGEKNYLKTLQPIGNELREVINNLEVKGDQISILRQVLNSSMNVKQQITNPLKFKSNPEEKSYKKHWASKKNPSDKPNFLLPTENFKRKSRENLVGVNNGPRSKSLGRSTSVGNSLSLLKSSQKVQQSLRESIEVQN